MNDFLTRLEPPQSTTANNKGHTDQTRLGHPGDEFARLMLGSLYSATPTRYRRMNLTF